MFKMKKFKTNNFGKMLQKSGEFVDEETIVVKFIVIILIIIPHYMSCS